MKTPFLLTALLTATMIVQSSLGLLFPGQYRDPLWAFSAWHGNDVVTATLAVPLLVLGLLSARRATPRGMLLWLGMLGYGVYNYAYYLLGAGLNVFFPLYVLALLFAASALILGLSCLDVHALASAASPRSPARLVGGYLTFVGVGLAIAWIAQWFAYVVNGRVPDIGVDGFRLVAALDLTLMSPLLVTGGVLLWRRRPWGYVLAALAGIQGATYTAVLTAGSYVGALNNLPGMWAQIPVWATCTALTSIAMLLLLVPMRQARPEGQA